MANIKVAKDIYLRNKSRVYQVNNKYRGNTLVGYKVDSINLSSKNLKPKTIKVFKSKTSALRFARR